jgi:hypothetical protein
MSHFFSRILDRVSAKDATPVNTFAGVTADGRVVLRDRRGTRKAEIPKRRDQVGDAQRRPACDLRASEVANIQLRLYQAEGKRGFDALL